MAPPQTDTGGTSPVVNDHNATGTVPGFTGKWRHTVKATWSAMVPSELPNIAAMAKYAPLIAAIIAPTSTLLDIPALTQRWYQRDGQTVKDPAGCVALSAIGLFLNVCANMLLLMRFSGTTRRWRRGTSLSLVFWIAKTIVAVINVAYYGTWRRGSPGYHYTEGFWCAVTSVSMSGVISILLLFHYIFAYDKIENGDSEDLRLTGRKFMFSVTFFMFLLGIQGFAFSRLEHWSYLDAIYFSVQCALTVGYGDLVPTTAGGKVLVFIFSVLTISQLANEVAIIIEFVRNRSQQKRNEWRKKYSIAMHHQAIERRPYATLIDEMSLIHQINMHQETMVQVFDLFWSGFWLATFWLIGAVIFKSVQHWSYGNSVYAVMVLSLTIGFGDYTPVTDAARVIWIVYALMAVPIVTNFAVQTVGGIMHTWSEHRFTRKRFEMERERDPEVFAPHSHFILRHHEEWDDMRDKYLLARDKAFAALYSLGHVVQEVEGVDAEGCDSADASSPKTESVSETKSESEPKSKPQPQPKRAASGSRPQLAPLHITSSIALSLQPPSTRLSPSSSISPGAQRLRKALHLTKAQKEVIGEMLDNPETHEEVVENLGYPEVVDADGSQGAGTTTTDADPETGLLTGTSLENPGDTSPSDRASSSTSTRVDPSYRRKPDDTCQAFKDTSVGVHRHKPAGSPTKSLDPPFVASVEPTEWTPNHRALQDCIPGMGPRLIQKGENGEEETKVQLTGDPMVDSHRLELYLIKELVDRVTRLEAQSRQMLIDCMDRDVARTLLLADRNLQVRDAFQLYGNKIDLERTYKEEAEQTREDYEKRRAEERKEVDRQAAVIDDLHGQDEDMLTRVRRYRNTFAEVLVLSSTLLKLEGDELKRFERWHVGDLRRNRTEVEHATVAVAQRKRKRKRDHVGGGLDKFIDWATAKPERTPRPEEPHVSDRKRIANFGRQVIGSFGRLTHHWGDSGDYSPGIPPPRALRKDGDEDGSPAAGTADVDPNADPDENDLDRLSDRLDDAEDEQAEVDAEVAADLEAQDETRHRGDTYVPFRGMRLRVPTDDDDEVTHRARPTASPEDSPEGSPRGWPTKKSKKHSLLSVVHRASASGPSASASGPQDSTSTAYPPHPASLSDKVKTTAKKTTHHLKERAMTRAANRIVADTDEEAIYLTNRFGQSIRHKYAGTSAMGNVPSDSGSAASPGVTSVSDLKGSTSASASAPPSAATSPGIDPHKHSHGHIHADGSQSTPGSWDPRRRHIRSRSGRHEGSGWLAHSTDAEVEVTERELAELASHQHTAHKPDPAFKRPEAHAQARLGAATLGKIAQSYAGFETYLGQRRDETRKERTQEEERRATARLEHLLAKEREKGRKEGREEKEREKNGDTGDGEEGGWR